MQLQHSNRNTIAIRNKEHFLRSVTTLQVFNKEETIEIKQDYIRYTYMHIMYSTRGKTHLSRECSTFHFHHCPTNKLGTRGALRYLSKKVKHQSWIIQNQRKNKKNIYYYYSTPNSLNHKTYIILIYLTIIIFILFIIIKRVCFLNTHTH